MNSRTGRKNSKNEWKASKYNSGKGEHGVELRKTRMATFELYL
jgi:hypothetical protein